MHFLKSLVFGVSALASLAAAQAKIQFTSNPQALEAGKPYTATWIGGTGGPVTITLRKGSSANLDTIAVLTSAATGGSFTFTPATTLQTGTDYALQITQGSDINYTGLFAITGGSATAPSSASAASALASVVSSASAASAASASTSAASASTSAAASSSSVSAAVTVSSLSSHASSSATLIGAANSNSTSSASASASASRSASSSLASTTRAASGSASASSTSSPSSTVVPAGNGVGRLSSPVALVLGALAAMVVLN